MSRKAYFKIGYAVMANSLTGQKIIGHFRGWRPNYIALVFGHAEGSTDPDTLHECRKLTLEKLPDPESQALIKPKKGDPCTALTTDLKPVTGFFMQSEGKYSWLKGWYQTQTKFDPMRVFKVKSYSVQRK